MKYLKFIFSGTIILTLIIGLFIPVVSINSEYLSSFLLVFSNNCSIYSLILFTCFLLGIASGALLIFENKSSYFVYASLILSLVSGVVILLAKDVIVGSLGDTDVISATAAPYVLGILTLLFGIYVCSFVFKINEFSIRDIVEMAMLIGLAVVLDLSFFKIRIGGNGGSISFAMVPLIILALRQGFVKGFIGCGLIFGLTTCLLDGYGFFTFPFDYLLGFGAIGVVGLFNKIILPNESKKFTFKGVLFIVISILVAGVLRLLSSTISGILFYGTNFVESLIYQCSYIPLSVLGCLIVTIALYKPLLLINSLFPLKNFE